ncbi:NADH-quinone oxidoreductase subunit L [Babesia caballi]|uniref:NADH-quinone oxidoreductase subunit L n=1 Tax=Babesia caballi TaxID=5871 RepID=A0AAV4M254_BABCB|nr:NADH-quinone oxidoreductase subunit L [Babesia caballi]
MASKSLAACVSAANHNAFKVSHTVLCRERGEADAFGGHMRGRGCSEVVRQGLLRVGREDVAGSGLVHSADHRDIAWAAFRLRGTFVTFHYAGALLIRAAVYLVYFARLRRLAQREIV